MDLFVKVQTQVVILNRLHAVCDLLRKILRTQSLTLQMLNKENILSPNLMFEIGKYNFLFILNIVAYQALLEK